MPEQMWLCKECGETFTHEELDDLPMETYKVPERDGSTTEIDVYSHCGEGVVLAPGGEKFMMNDAIEVRS